MHAATQLLVILSAGLASQWLAWRIGVPAIVVLIATGLVLGPATGVIEFGQAGAELSQLIGLGVAIILFEGGMDLKFAEFRRVGPGVLRLTILGPPLAWLLASLAAHVIAGLSWPVAVVLGAILVVTGPTVILPLLQQARLDKQSASLLKWEGIVNDPIGVLLAVLAFQYLTTGGGWIATLSGFGKAFAAAAVLGGAGGWLTGWVYKRGLVPDHLKAPFLMGLVLAVYWGSNLVQHEAGLLSVTLMGLVIGNMQLVERETLQRFKAHLTIVLLAVLFIVIPSQLSASQLDVLDGRTAGFLLALMLVVRPLTIALATLGAKLRWQDKVLLAWIAPRGIVAAATASIFGPALVDAGYPDAARLLPLMFAVIIVTVLAHGLSIGPLGRRLGLAAKAANGLLIVGASAFGCALAKTLKTLGIDVLIVDGAYHRLKDARMAGIDVQYGEILSEQVEATLETQHLSHLLCATDNDFYNALVCKALGRNFGHHRTFQIPTYQASAGELQRLTLQQRGYFAFDTQANFEVLAERLGSGWTVRSAKLGPETGWDELCDRLGEAGRDRLLLAAISPEGVFRLYSKEQRFKLDSGWTAIYLAPDRTGAPPATPTDA